MIVGRFAPSTTGEAHPGTLVSGLLAWLDARSRGGRIVLRLEDLERSRTKLAWAYDMQHALGWLGLDWDRVVVQSDRGAAHAAALDTLAAKGRLYPCSCSRSDRKGGRRAPDGGWAYDNTCRDKPLPAAGWRASTEILRAQLDDDRIELVDDGGLDLSQTPAYDMGDPIVRRRDGSVAYQLAVVVDDADEGITHVVRGHDIAPSTATQVALHRLLALTPPRYRHHALLLEPDGDKLAKLHGSIPFSLVKERYRGDELCAVLAEGIGLRAEPARSLVSSFTWSDVTTTDQVAVWTDDGLVIGK